MAAKVISENEVSLNGVYYPLVAPVQSSLASIYPGKIVIGDTTKDSQTRTSIIAWSNFQGGIGVNRMEGSGDVGRAWWSTAQLRYKNHLVMGGLVTQTAAVSHGLSNSTIGAIGELNDEVYAVWNGSASESPKLYKYNNTTDSWGSEVSSHGIADQVTDTITWTASNNTTYLVFAHYDSNGSGYSHSSNGSSWTNDTADTKFLTVWDDRLWGIDHTGQLWWSITIGSETNDAKIPLPDGYVTGMFVARDAGGEPIIYVSTKKGLFAHDAANTRFVETQLFLPFHPDAGKGAIRWRDSVYVPSGLGIYKYINGASAAVVTIMGPDRDDGLPKDKRGSITKTAATHNELLVAVDASSAPITITDRDKMPYQWASHQGSDVIDAGYSSILGWDERGWETKWLSSSAGRSVTALTVNNSYDDYRMWWGFDDNVYHMTMPSNIINPSEVGNFEYAESGVHETPWVNAGQSEVDKLAINLKVEVQNTSSSETVTVQYAIDYSESYESMGTITSNGTTTYTFDDANDNPVGVTFRAIKFKLTFARATGLTNKLKSPDVVSMTLEFRKKLPAKYGHQARINLNKPYKGKSSKDLRSSIVSAIESNTLIEFTFRDDSGGTRNYYVDVISASGIEGTGYDERGTSTINLVEP